MDNNRLGVFTILYYDTDFAGESTLKSLPPPQQSDDKNNVVL